MPYTSGGLKPSACSRAHTARPILIVTGVFSCLGGNDTDQCAVEDHFNLTSPLCGQCQEGCVRKKKGCVVSAIMYQSTDSECLLASGIVCLCLCTAAPPVCHTQLCPSYGVGLFMSGLLIVLGTAGIWFMLRGTRVSLCVGCSGRMVNVVERHMCEGAVPCCPSSCLPSFSSHHTFVVFHRDCCKCIAVVFAKPPMS